MANRGIAAYKTNSVTTQTKGQIVVLLYEGAIRFLKQAVTAMEQQDYIEKGRLINRALDIICELNSALDLDAGGEIAQNLRQLYSFMHQHLLTASFKKDPQKVREVIKMLEQLLDGWRQVAA
jgi:flagellar protein FliS